MGTHDDLLARPHGLYRRLYQIQFAAADPVLWEAPR
jgi:ABC-type multidrug transport system fused ATPase/permease subunit